MGKMTDPDSDDNLQCHQALPIVQLQDETPSVSLDLHYLSSLYVWNELPLEF